MKTLFNSIAAMAGLILSAATLHAYERLQGPTEVLYWSRAKTYDGYTFFCAQGTTYLIDMEGRVAHTWPIGNNPRLLDSGHVLDLTNSTLRELDWSGSNAWSYTEARAGYTPHHDVLRIFNPKLGTNTTLYIASKSITSNQCIAAGCNPASAPYTNVTVDAVVEVDLSGSIVWEWCLFDHGAQNFDPAKSNYVASISNAPGRINLNLPGRPLTNDWLHCNSIDFNTNLDQIVITAAGGEFYVIDHGNTFVAGNPAASIALAVGSAGDFLYRFGDPARYSQGSAPSIQQNWSTSTTGNKQIGASSSAHWIPAGLPGAGHFLVFNNGGDLFETTPQSYVLEINGCLNASSNDTGAYVNPPTAGYTTWSPPGHDTDKKNKLMSRQITWTYYSMANQGMFSHLDSSAQRLANGNTLICDSTEGHIFEVTSAGEAVWEYINPVSTAGIVAYKRDQWPMYNAVFRAWRYAASHPSLSGRTLTPQDTITRQQPAYLSAPLISGTSRSPTSPGSSEAVLVSASVTNAGVVAAVTLTYIVGVSTNTLTMTNSGSLYAAQIPAFSAGTTVAYYITARDDFDLSATDPATAPTGRYSYVVATNSIAPIQCDVLLGRPAASSIAISIIATNNLDAYVEYGTGSGSYAAQSSNATLATGTPACISIDSLQADQLYYYRLRLRPSGESAYGYGVERTFHTQRAADSSFTFDIEADPHYLDPNSAISPALWQRAMTNILADQPDFLIDLGDTFMDEKLGVTNKAEVVQLRRDVRSQFFRIAGHSVPLFLANGNHDAELGWLRDGTSSNLAVWGAADRQLYYPCPSTNAFFSFAWGNALFVVLDPFWNTTTKPSIGPDVWNWTLGTNQYAWLQQTLTNSTATFKFVFIHHLVGGSADGNGRGGLETARFGEWGGYNTNGTWGFDTFRAGWATPIENMLLANGVTAVFHGHDHLFVKQDRDVNGDGAADLIYQECPQPSATNYNTTATAAGYGYTNGIIQGNSGHIRVTVTATNASVAYVRAYLPSDEGSGKTNGAVSYAYSISAPAAPGAWTMAALPDTGQTQSYTATAGEDSDYTINPPSFTNNGDGTVRDNVTGLTWQQADAGEMTWSNALVYAQTNRTGGYSDWRLPTAHEAFSILNHGTVNPALDTGVFTLSAAQYWWTADTQVTDASRVWAINAGGGIGAHRQDETLSAGGTNRYHTRCVRGAAASSRPVHHFTNNPDGTVTDQDTGLTWQQSDGAGAMSWESALQYAENLSLAGNTDWHLPNIKELQSINDETKTNPSLDTNYFSGANSALHWSSTTVMNLTNRAWSVDFQLGLVSYTDKASNLYARCVRGGATNSPPSIGTVTMIEDAGGNAAWITAQVADDAGLGQVTLSYGTAGGVSVTNTVFLETMATNAVKPWTGSGCDHPWTVSYVGGNPFEQRSGANYGAGNTNGLEFKNGTANLADATVTSTSIDAQGTSGSVEFYVTANNQAGTSGWAFQVNGGTGFVTRLSENTGTNHAWQVYHHDLYPSELVSNITLRFQFAGGLTSNRVDLDRITVKTVNGGSSWNNVPMYDDGLHGDGVAGDGIYGAGIPAQVPGTLVNYFVTATDAGGLSTRSPAGSGDSYSYYAITAPNLVLGRPTGTSVAINELADSSVAAWFEYGTQSAVYASQTALTNLTSGQPAETELTGLLPDTRYYYRIRYKAAGETSYHAGGERTFHTARAPDSPFVFCIQGDSHPERANAQFEAAHYSNTLLTAAADQPDFYMAIGDDFSVDQIPTNLINAALVTERYTIQRPYLGLVGASAPLFLVNGNHEQAAAYLLDGTSNNIAVWAQNARNAYYPQPAPDGFYTGNTNAVEHIGLLRNYYAWTWGDALFVTLDPYWASSVCVDDNYWTGVKRTNLWDVTHGDAQYQWLKTTLEQSQARFKFVFAHHVLGTGRGGVEEAGDYEWGGKNGNGSWGFATNRPGWPLPIHQLMATNHVTIFFQGHDHLFAHQQLDGVTYLTLPEPADPTYTMWNDDAYTNTIYKTNNTGYVRLTVQPEQVEIDYVRTYLPAEEGAGKTNGMVDYSYVIDSPRAGDMAVSNGVSRFSFYGTLHQNHALMATTNLTSGEWTPVLSTNVTETPFFWSDPDSTNYRQRFYRLQYTP
jgi:phosphodiesterase/alkaline phosphatase D-like protein